MRIHPRSARPRARVRNRLAEIGLATLGFALSATTTTAAATDMSTATGQRYRVSLNDHGAVLHGTGGPVYLGRDCDAWSKRDGKGRWQWANGGVVVELGDARLAFPRQDPPLRDADACRA